MVFLQFLPLIALLVIANLGETSSGWKTLITILLALLNLLILVFGIFALAIPLALAAQPASPQTELFLQFHWTALSPWLIGTALLGSLPLLPAVRRAIGRRLPIDPQSAVHMTALVFAVYLAMMTPAQLAWLGNLDALTALSGSNGGALVGASELWQQGASFIIMALAGVGLWIRRPAEEVNTRLGLALPTLRQWGVVLGVTLLFIGLDFGISAIWSQIDQAGYEQIAKVTQAMFGGLITPLGALTIGLSAGLGEELIFRGALQPRFGILLTSFLFAISHLQYGLSPAFLQVFLLGIGLGLVRERGNLTMSIGIHTLYNFTLAFLAFLGTTNV